MTRPVFMIAAKRSAVAPKGGQLAEFSVDDLSAPVIKSCLQSANITPEMIDEIICSNALYGGGNPARLVAMRAGLPERVAGLSIDRQCSGGLDAIGLGVALIKSGQADCVIAGGVESASLRPQRAGFDPASNSYVPYDRPPFVPKGTPDPDPHKSAGELAELEDISGFSQAEWTVSSHQKALRSKEHLQTEIVAIGKAEHDSYTRDLTLKHVNKSPVLDGGLRAATAAVSADAAAFTILSATPPKYGKYIEILSQKTLGGDPERSGIIPVAAAQKALQESGNPVLNRVEIMEAYAVQAQAVVAHLGLLPSIVNIHGGALARGHPIGASGAILAVRLFHDLKQGETGLCAIAAMGGIGSAMVLRG